MKHNTILAEQNKDFSITSFDLQKALPFPSLKTSVVSYKINVYYYNLAKHNLETDKAIMYVWDENISSRTY